LNKTFFPFLLWRRRITRETLTQDLVAGLTGAIVVLPQGVAFALVAGLPPQYGLYAGMIPAIVAALFGSSWHLVSGPTTAASVVLFSALSALSTPGSAEYVQFALTLTFMVGIMELGLGAMRMGTIVNFVSHSVIVGFTTGAAIVIATTQLKHFIGVDIPRGGHVYETVINIARHIGDANPYDVIIGGVTLASGVLVRRWFPRIPYMLFAMIIGTVCGVALQYVLGPERTSIELVGALPATLPPLSAPSADLGDIKKLFPAAVAMTLFALTEAATIARSLAVRSGQRIDGNQEFIGQGLSNIVGSFFSSYVATGSFNRSALNYASGAQTPVSAVFAGALLMVLVLVLAPLAAYLPNAAMAGILFLVAWTLVDVFHIRRIVRASRPETVVLAVTLFTAILMDLEHAILVGVGMSLLMHLMQIARPRLLSRVPDPNSPRRSFTSGPGQIECPQLKIVRVDGSLFFGSVHHVEKLLRAFENRRPEQKHLLLVAVGINHVDTSGAEFLVDEAKHRRQNGGNLYLCRMKDETVTFLRRGGYMKEIGEPNLFRGKTESIHAIFERLDGSICASCKARIFRECQEQYGPPDPK